MAMRKNDLITSLKSIDFDNLPLPVIVQKLERVNPDFAHQVIDKLELYQRNRADMQRYLEEQSVGHQLRSCFTKVACFIREKLHIEKPNNGNIRNNEDNFSFDAKTVPSDIRRAINDVMLDNYFSQVALLTPQEQHSLKISP